MDLITLFKHVMSIEGRLPAKNFLQVRQEKWVHLYSGDHYKYHHVDNALVNNTSFDILLIGGNAEIELSFQIWSEGLSKAFLYESLITSDNGIEQVFYNHNRVASGRNPNMQVFLAPTISDVGTLLLEVPFATGTSVGHASSGGYSNENDTWIIRPNVKYLVRLTNLSGGNVIAAAQVDWSVHNG